MPGFQWDALRADEIRDLAAENAVVLVPVASTEQHGPHLPTGVDVVLCTEVCVRAAAKVKGMPVLVTPCVWMGLADHHVAFGGTFSISLATYHALLQDLCRSLAACGFERIVLVNGHGGNVSALDVLNRELTRELGIKVANTTYFILAQDAFSKILEDQVGVLHACEAETSMMLALRPDLVAAARLSDAIGPAIDDSPAAALRPPLHRWRSFSELTSTGVIGDARRASAEKGELLLAAASELLAEKISRREPWHTCFSLSGAPDQKANER